MCLTSAFYAANSGLLLFVVLMSKKPATALTTERRAMSDPAWQSYEMKGRLMRELGVKADDAPVSTACAALCHALVARLVVEERQASYRGERATKRRRHQKEAETPA